MFNLNESIGRAEVKNIPQATCRPTKSRHEFWAKIHLINSNLRDESMGIRVSSVILMEGLY